MADEILSHDLNSKNVMGAIGDDADLDIVQVRVDPITKRLKVDIEGGTASTIVGGRKTVVVSNTAVRLVAATTTCIKIVIQALRGNTGDIAIGDSAVVLTPGAEVGIVLPQQNSITIEIDDVYKIYINGAAGDGVSFLYFV